MVQPERPQEESLAPVAFGATVTILFSDIRGFTEYTEEHGDEAAYRMLQHHNTLVQEQIALYGGHVVKSLGDSYMVSFDSARTAVTCGVAMQRAVEQYNRAQQGPKIEIGVGINTGEPVRDADDLFGGAVNLASRICAAAEGTRVLVSETARHVVGRMEGSEWIDRGSFELKGFQEPQRLYEVDWSGVGAVRATRVAAPPGTTRAEVAPPPPQVAPSPLPVSGTERRRRSLAWAGAAAAGVLLLAGAVGGVMFLSGRSAAPSGGAEPQSAQAPSPPAGAPTESAAQATTSGKLLRSDDFSNPAKGLFLDNQRGTGRITFNDGTTHEFQWEHAYASGALIGAIKGPYHGKTEPRILSAAAGASHKIFTDFAVEVRARATKSPGQAEYILRYSMAADDLVQFAVRPGTGQYFIYSRKESRVLTTGRSSAVKRGSEENHLRIEVRGDTMKAFVNGQEVDFAQHLSLATRGGTIQLVWQMLGPPSDGEVEVRFTDFKVYSLER